MKVFNKILKCCLLLALMMVTSLSVGFAQAEGCVLVIPVNASSDDAEESGDGTGDVSLTSSDLEMTFDGDRGYQTVGIRFNNVQIPNGVSISSAYIQFTAERVNGDATTLTIQGESTDDATAFSATNFDISNRSKTNASVDWSPPEWNTIGEVGTGQQTTDISVILEEIVGRPGWSSGNSITLIITGAEKRSAVSFDGDPSMAPVLYIEFGAEGTICNDGDDATINDTINGDCQCVGQLDTDGDGTPDEEEECDQDPNKTEPGACGCGVVDSDTDTDGDGTLDCLDNCPDDPNKTEPGACGCGVVDSDTDTDGDGTLDCLDNCPEDPDKTEPGTCGCGVADADTDGDGTLDCLDNCPDDPNKTEPGACGCGVVDSETDTDGDGTLDCLDNCPDDPNKTEPGACGCGVVDSETDTDGDGTLDCLDNCPDDPDKMEPGTCGCGVADTDTDEDSTPNCEDNCPEDPDKTEPGTCGCGTPDTDTDEDGTPDCEDNCSEDPNKTEPGVCGCGESDVDTDQDGVLDCDDLCPEDPNKTEPGECGCGMADEDTDGDGVIDCEMDACPDDPDKTEPGACGCGTPDTDTDGDGTPDCDDVCPMDPDKVEAGYCGCGVSETDTDGDGTPDCSDWCVEDPNKIEEGQCGCGTPDTDTDGDGIADCVDPCPENPEDDCEEPTDGEEEEPTCADLDGCENEITFPACDRVVVCTGEKITQIVVDLGPTGFEHYSIDPKFTAINDTHWEYTAPEGQTINGVWVKTLGFCDKCGDEEAFSCVDCEGDPCPRGNGAGRYYAIDLCECGEEDVADSDEDGIPDCRDLCPDDAANECDANAGGGDDDEDPDNMDDDNGDPGDDHDDTPDVACSDLDGCENEITFLACDQVVVCTGEKITQIVVDLGPTGFEHYSIDPKFTAINDTHWEYMAPEGQTINGVWVKTLGFCDKCGDEEAFSCIGCEGDPCPRGNGGGRYYRNTEEECIFDPVTDPEARINLTLYPNPTTQHLVIQFNNPDSRPGMVQVLNANGERIYETNINEWTEENLRVDLANAPHGLYFLRMILDNGIVITRQFVLAR